MVHLSSSWLASINNWNVSPPQTILGPFHTSSVAAMCTKFPAQQKNFCHNNSWWVRWVWRPYSLTSFNNRSSAHTAAADWCPKISSYAAYRIQNTKKSRKHVENFHKKNPSKMSFLAGVRCIVSCGKPNPFGGAAGQATAQIIICMHSFWPGTGSSVCHNTSP